jgi:hypothetical protein
VVLWTGREMLVWGGAERVEPQRGFVDGARYDPRTDTWQALAEPGLRSPYPAAQTIWTGTAMLALGPARDLAYQPVAGASYDPATDAWTFLTDPELLSLYDFQAVWTGVEALLWGGCASGDQPVAEHRFDPASGTCAELSASSGLDCRSDAAIVWTGRELIVWGGDAALSEGGRAPTSTGRRFDLGDGRWRAMPLSGIPSARSGAHAVWTGYAVLVSGGHPGNGLVIYYPHWPSG